MSRASVECSAADDSATADTATGGTATADTATGGAAMAPPVVVRYVARPRRSAGTRFTRRSGPGPAGPWTPAGPGAIRSALRSWDRRPSTPAALRAPRDVSCHGRCEDRTAVCCGERRGASGSPGPAHGPMRRQPEVAGCAASHSSVGLPRGGLRPFSHMSRPHLTPTPPATPLSAHRTPLCLPTGGISPHQGRRSATAMSIAMPSRVTVTVVEAAASAKRPPATRVS